MLRPRVIPVLLAQRGGLVKTRTFTDPVYVGDPLNAIRIFNEKEVDELALLDISASVQTGPDLRLIEAVATECFMPLSYGGAVRGLADAKALFARGVEKVFLRRAAANDLGIVTAIADYAGSQSVAVCIDVRRNRLGALRAHSPGTPLHKASNWLAFARAAESAGAGEILIQSIDRDGTMKGMDLSLISQVAGAVSTPILGVGGVGSLADVREALEAGCTAVGVGAFFVLQGPRRAVLISYPSPDELNAIGGLTDG